MSISNKQTEVVVLCVNGRRVTIKTSITTSIGQVIEEACTKQKLDPYDYNLKHLKRVLDPSNSLQYSNIPNHALLELIEAPKRRVEGNVTVNLVTDTGQRLIADFPSSTYLIEILEYHKRRDETNFTIVSASSSEESFIVYSMRKIVGDELRSVSLKSLGLYGGRCMLRYGVQKAASGSVSSPIVITKPKLSAKITQSDAAKSISDENNTEENLKLQNAEPMDSATTNLSTISEREASLPEFRNQDEILPGTDKLVNNEEKKESSENNVAVEQMDCDSLMRERINDCVTSSTEDSVDLAQRNLPLKTESSLPEKIEQPRDNIQPRLTPNKTKFKVIPLADHDSVLFNLDDAPQTVSEKENDDFFELSVNEVRKLYSEKVRELKELDDAPLMTQQMRQLEQDSRLLSAMNRHPVTQLRICFPDRHVIQANFKPRNTIREVMDFIRPLLITSDLEFSFYTPFPRKVLDPSFSLVEADCIPKARLYFSAEGGPNFLSDETLAKKSSFEGASSAVVVSNNSTSACTGEQHLSSDTLQPVSQTCDNATAQDYINRATPKVISPTQHKPKWFKLGK